MQIAKLRSVLALSVSLLFLQTSLPAAAFTVGIDQKTSDLLQSFPGEIRQALIDGLQQGEPIILDTIDKTLDRTDKSLDHFTDNALCAMDQLPGTTRQSVDAFKKGITGGTASYAAQPVGAWQAFEYKTRRTLNPTTIPRNGELAYAAIIDNGFPILCRTARAEPTVHDIMEDALAGDYLAAGAWVFLANLKCANARACYKPAYELVVADISAADKRDRANSHADNQLSDISKPDNISIYGFKGRLTLDDSEFETTVEKLVLLEYRLASARYSRIGQSAQVLDGLQAKYRELNGIEHDFDVNIGSTDRTNPDVGGTNAINAFTAIFKTIDLNTVLQLAHSIATETDGRAKTMHDEYPSYVTWLAQAPSRRQKAMDYDQKMYPKH